MSVSWQHFEMIIGELLPTTDQWPRTNECAWCHGMTPSLAWMETISPSAPGADDFLHLAVEGGKPQHEADHHAAVGPAGERLDLQHLPGAVAIGFSSSTS